MQYHQMFAVVGVIALSAVFHAPARAQTRQAELEGFQEVPVVSTTGEGRCRVKISSDHTMIEAEISFSNLQGNVTQAHIHLGQKDVNGGVAVFFCSNLPSPPAGTPFCPGPSGTVARFFFSTDVQNVVGANGFQGIAPGELEELITAIRKGKPYCNVHSDIFPAGEIRGQLY